MSIPQTQPNSDFDFEIALATAEDVEFNRLQGILHGEYQQSQGSLHLDEEYDVTVTERDESYHLQIRGTNGIEHEAYIDSENPYEALPESDEELYDLLSEEVQ